MTVQQAKYEDIRGLLQPGDVFVFSGKEFISDAIKVYTGGIPAALEGKAVPSHIATVYKRVQDGTMRVYLIECTTDDVTADPKAAHTGVQISLASARLSYPGSVYALLLNDVERMKFDETAFNAFCTAHEGDKYDKGEIVKMALDPLGVFRVKDNYLSFVCSGFASALQKAEGFLSATVNTHAITPEDEVVLKLWKDPYFQFTGKPAELYNFNTQDAASFER
jgi:hypothetical protein